MEEKNIGEKMGRKRFNKFGKFGEKDVNRQERENFVPNISSGLKNANNNNKIEAAKKLKEIEFYAQDVSNNDSLWIGRMRDVVLSDNKILSKKQIEIINDLYKRLVPNKVQVEKILMPNKQGSQKAVLVDNLQDVTIQKDISSKSSKNVKDVNIYCDGACVPNPGQSGVGIAIYNKDKLDKLYYGGYQIDSTNNIAELKGLLYACQMAEQFIKEGKSVQIFCDSTYAIDCITSWAYGWKKRGWVKKQDQPIKNVELVKEAHEIFIRIKNNIEILYVKGHSGVEGNELADKMSLFGIYKKEIQLKQYEGSLSELLKSLK